MHPTHFCDKKSALTRTPLCSSLRSHRRVTGFRTAASSFVALLYPRGPPPGLWDDEAGTLKRGRPSSALSTNCYRPNEKYNMTMWWTARIYCYAAHVKDKATVTFPTHLHGRKETEKKHLAECPYLTGATGTAFRGAEGLQKRNAPLQLNLYLLKNLSFGACCWSFKLKPYSLIPFGALVSFRRLLVFLNARCGVLGAVPNRHIIGDRVLDAFAELQYLQVLWYNLFVCVPTGIVVQLVCGRRVGVREHSGDLQHFEPEVHHQEL
ncbi:hypothetical protein PHYSODRAFT_302058 [Phytophthora sojae]|uniref:Uncharacterized protein n=1 Tax=Phytophthora sojae (strain P6497) TaxID=1094619 RepID=G4ZL60_PHYSP|nr:hypothetical protein PHYSODRAFT_302058 [Phytophthora sojae]EGZ15574.1 hypothetical protein PHYSODRAFT_302058 [Phytophthora sojae]|eukprot:XP_009529323.1 hypothetical protein PHYSODRAFT_302058 [Phytophthora sojae]